jgi:hypothetical protein
MFELLWTEMEKQEACALALLSEEKKEEELSACSSSSQLAQAIAPEPWAGTTSICVAADHTFGTQFGWR